MRILFVDDEPQVLDGLRRSLRGFRREWQMRFAGSGEEALRVLAEEPADVIVTDMRMPGMNGAELLERVHAEHPETVRFVLSGHSELEGVMRAVPVAHQFLSKPCEPEALREAIRRAVEIQRILGDEELRRVVGGTESLPSLPETYQAVVRALRDPEVEIGAVAAILEDDLGMSAKVLQMVNSGFFGLPRSVTDVREAATYLGLETLRDLALSTAVFRPPPDAGPEALQLVREVHGFSMRVAALASRLCEEKRLAAAAFTAGMLHEVGILLFASKLRERLEASLARARREGTPLPAAERAELGVGHAEAGAYLLGVWGLPYPILEAAAYHHDPRALPHQERFSALTAVHVARSLVIGRLASRPAFLECDGALDLAYLDELGLRDRLPAWEALADEVEAGVPA